MTTRDETPIQSVKTSKPHYHHNHSYQPSSASHEISSDYASEVSSTSAEGYETPPSRVSTPDISHPNQVGMTVSANQGTAYPILPPIRTSEDQAYSGQRRTLHIPRSLNNMSPPTPGVDDTPYIRFAIEQLSFDEELSGQGRYSHLDQFVHPRPQPVQEPVQIPQPAPTRSTKEPNRPPQPFRFPSSSLDRPRNRVQETLIPVDAPDGAQWTKLGYVPIPLRPYVLAFLILVSGLMIAAIIFSNVHAIRSHGLYDYNGITTPRYFVFQYLPQMVGIAIICWLFVIQAAIYRALPYFVFSAELLRDRALQDLPITPANFVLPDFRFFGLKEPLVGTILVIFWLMNWTIPLLACFYQTQYYLDINPPRFRWSTVQGLGWFLVALYVLLIIALFCCMIRFRSRRSALLWDPKSLADVIAVFQRSNILMDFEQSEVSADLRSHLPPRFLRMGYWTPSTSPEMYHTIGQHNAPLNRLSAQDVKQMQPEHRDNEKGRSSDSFDIERHRYSNDSNFTRDIHSPFIRYRWCPWYLRDNAVLVWVVVAILLLIAFLVVSYVNRAVQDGFYPLVPSRTQSNGFSPSNFLYTFLPALLGTFLFLVWQPVDTFYRSIQPFANLSNPNGTTAQKSLLQSYTASPLLVVTLQALRNSDFKLAYITFISVLSATIPILAGGVFTAILFPDGDVRMVASMPGYIALSVFLALFALSCVLLFPTRTRYLPHPITTVAGQLSFLYASPLLNDPNIRGARSKRELVARLSGHVGPVGPSDPKLNEKPRSGLTGDGRRKIRERYTGAGNTWVDRQLKYAFGIYLGRDGKEHLGIDRLQRPGSGEMLIVTGGGRKSFGGRSR